jgi:hypothetical protein
LLKSQQDQLATLEQKLADETKGTPAASDRVIAVEPAQSAPAPEAQPAPSPAAAPADASGDEATKLAATDSKGPGEGAVEPATAVEAPLPEAASRQDLAQDISSELKRLGCYFGSVNGTWNARTKLALERFNRVSALDLPLDEPEQASLDALKEWKGKHCPVEARIKARRPAAAVEPKKPVIRKKKAVTAAPPRAPAAVQPRPRRGPSGGSAEKNELQRMFPSTAWPD